MAELASHRPGAVHQLSVQQQPHADAFRHRHRDDVADVLGVTAEPQLGECTRVGGVLHVHGQPDGRLDHLRQLHRTPTEVRREHQTAAVVDAAWKADAHPFAQHPRMSAAEVACGRPRSSTNCSGVVAVANVACPMKRASTPASPMVVVSGRSSTPSIPARSTFRCRLRGRRPRGDRPTAPSVTHPSSIS